MTPDTANYQLYVGIDIAATTFVAAWMPAGAALTPPVTHPQRPGGFAALQRQLAATGIASVATLVVLEATGSYWVALAVTLHTAGYAVSVINPLQAHHFAKAQLRRAKTDPLDAQNLAQLAAALRPAVWTPPPAVYHEIRQRLTARDALVAMRQQTRNQRHALVQWPVVVASVRHHLDDVIAMFDARIADLEAEIATVLAASDWAESPGALWAACLTSAPGIAGALWADDRRMAAGEHDELHPVRHTGSGDGRVPAGQDGIGADAAHLGNERARAGTHRARGKRTLADRALHGDAGGGAVQPGDQDLLRPLAHGREAEQGGALCGGAQAVAPGVGVGDEAATVSVESSNLRLCAARCLTTNTVSLGSRG